MSEWVETVLTECGRESFVCAIIRQTEIAPIGFLLGFAGILLPSAAPTPPPPPADTGELYWKFNTFHFPVLLVPRCFNSRSDVQ